MNALRKPSAPPGRPLSAITEEIQFYKAQAGQCIVEIGKRLLEAKEQLPHGQWESWLEKSVEFTPRTARNFMKIASEFDSNRKPVSDLPYTKLLALLQLPPEEREEFIAEPHTVNGREKTVDEMTKRELQAAVKEKNEAVKARKDAERQLADERARAEQAEKAKEGLEWSLSASRHTVETLHKSIDAKESALTSLREEVDRLRALPHQKTEIPESEKEACGSREQEWQTRQTAASLRRCAKSSRRRGLRSSILFRRTKLLRQLFTSTRRYRPRQSSCARSSGLCRWLSPPGNSPCVRNSSSGRGTSFT